MHAWACACAMCIVRVHVYIRGCVDACACAYVYVFVHAGMHVPVYTGVCAGACRRMQMNACLCTCTHVCGMHVQACGGMCGLCILEADLFAGADTPSDASWRLATPLRRSRTRRFTLSNFRAYICIFGRISRSPPGSEA